MLQLFTTQQDASTPLHCPGLSQKDFTSDRRGSEIGSPPCFFQRNHSFRRGIGKTPRGKHEACCDLRCVPYANSAPCLLFFPSVCRRGKSFSDRKGPKKPSGRGREQGRPMPTATITRPGQAKEGQPSVNASTPQASNKRKVEPRDDTSQTP